jgi:hypothetical protein
MPWADRSGPPFSFDAVATAAEPIHQHHEERYNRNSSQRCNRVHHGSTPASHTASDAKTSQVAIPRATSSHENGRSLTVCPNTRPAAPRLAISRSIVTIAIRCCGFHRSIVALASVIASGVPSHLLAFRRPAGLECQYLKRRKGISGAGI